MHKTVPAKAWPNDHHIEPIPPMHDLLHSLLDLFLHKYSCNKLKSCAFSYHDGLLPSSHGSGRLPEDVQVEVAPSKLGA